MPPSPKPRHSQPDDSPVQTASCRTTLPRPGWRQKVLLAIFIVLEILWIAALVVMAC